MKVLITGHKGFVGSHFLNYFKKRGDHVVGIDIKDGLDCRDFFKSCYEKFDLVVHLAAIVGGREMIENEPLAVATDLSIDSEMFNWAVRTKQEKIIYYSSSAAYPIKYQKRNSNVKMEESFIDLNNSLLPIIFLRFPIIFGSFNIFLISSLSIKFFIVSGLNIFIKFSIIYLKSIK